MMMITNSAVVGYNMKTTVASGPEPTTFSKAEWHLRPVSACPDKTKHHDSSQYVLACHGLTPASN